MQQKSCEEEFLTRKAAERVLVPTSRLPSREIAFCWERCGCYTSGSLYKLYLARSDIIKTYFSHAGALEDKHSCSGRRTDRVVTTQSCYCMRGDEWCVDFHDWSWGLLPAHTQSTALRYSNFCFATSSVSTTSCWR